MKRRLLWLLALVGGAAALLALHAPTRTLVAGLAPEPLAKMLALQKSDPNVAPALGKGQGKGGKGRAAAAPVLAAEVVRRDMPIVITAPGTVEAEATVAVKSRVDGQIAAVAFKEGDLVQKGQVLFRLDERLVQAQIRQAEANIRRDEANLKDAMGTLERRQTLVQKKIVSEAATDTARMSVEALKAGIVAGQAALEGQRTLLDYLTITAPITGRTGNASVRPGSNVRSADTQPLVVINQTSPISVAFAVPQTELLALRRALATGATAEVRVAGTSPLVLKGTIDFIDNQVDKQTGTLTAKIKVTNSDEVLWPGQSVEVALTVELRKEMLAVPASAVLPAQQGMVAWVIGADMRVTPRTVRLERIAGDLAYIAEGLQPGEQVVTDGHVRISSGSLVVVQRPGESKPPAAKPGAGKKGGRGDDGKS